MPGDDVAAAALEPAELDPAGLDRSGLDRAAATEVRGEAPSGEAPSGEAPSGEVPSGEVPPVEAPAPSGPAAGVHDCLHLDPETRRDASLRLKSARGHLDGIVRMLDDPEVYCVDVLKQIKAVQGALSRVNGAVLRSHVRDHVATASQRGDTDAIVDELMEALKYRT